MVTRMYSYVFVFTRMLLVCNRMYSYVNRMNSYTTRMYWYVNRMYSYVLVCYSYVLVWCFSHERKAQQFMMKPIAKKDLDLIRNAKRLLLKILLCLKYGY